MQFREDINGLRAIAVIAVVLFHFNSSWMPGGFAGVDVFFVISGFLMTGIIFKGLEQQKFSILRFYIARANRIIPALALLCIILLIFGWFFLSPTEYKALGKHAVSSVGFISNNIYWLESGYFDSSSHEKWLLHTWSLSVEWQFYIIYPIILVVSSKILSLKMTKRMLLLGTVIGFVFCVLVTYKWPNASYYLFPSRAWEMMIGGVAYLYPSRFGNKQNKVLEIIGVLFILGSYFFVTKETPWPGYLAIFPVLGAFLIIQANSKNSFITGNLLFQKVGAWSYSIYLWHWPIVVAIAYFSLSKNFIYIGIILSIFLGYLSNKYIEKIKFFNDFNTPISYLRSKPIIIAISTVSLGLIVYSTNGFFKFSPIEYQNLINSSTPSPYRNMCHIKEYRAPEKSCEYFGSRITWATFGDSHSTEIAYAMALRLKEKNIGLKHFSFSGCKPSYKEPDSFSVCAKWYNESASYILESKEIKNVIFNHRFTNMLLGGTAEHYPVVDKPIVTNEAIRLTKHMDELILKLAESKDNIYIFLPIPELNKNIFKLINNATKSNASLNDIASTDINWYNKRNKYIINHFNSAEFPNNVHLLNPADAFCNSEKCFAVRNGIPLYFDDNHPSVLGAIELVKLIK